MARHRCLMALMLVGCSSSADLPAPVLGGDGFFGAPWPDDVRMVDGRLDLTGFPGTGTFATLDKYLAVAATLDGYGLNAPVYIDFDGPLDQDLLPDPEDSASLDASVLLLDIDPDSEHRGELVPYTWDLEIDGTDWQPAGLLAVQPVWGFPLRPRTTYALVVRTSIAQVASGFSLDPLSDDPQVTRYAPLRETLEDLGIGWQDVAAATMFTTQDPTEEMVRFSDVIHEDLPTPPLDQTVHEWDHTRWFRAYEGHVRIPLWQHGDKPYLTEGGGFEFAEDGTPVLGSWEDVLFTFTVPADDAPEGGWPVALNAHGTGGDDRSHAEGGKLCPAAVLARAGMAIFEIAQPLHGDRGTGIDPTLVSFNFLNPASARATFRQGALDLVYLAHLLTTRAHCFTLDDDQSQACTDPTKVAFLGHSQGGITGAMAAPFWDGEVQAAVFSGAGGGLSVSMLQRDTSEFDVNALLTDELGLTLDELDLHHPLVALVQTLSEVTDPINYGRYWFEEPVDGVAPPLDVLQTEGTEDQYTPPPTIEALAGSAGLPTLDPVAQSSDAALLRGLVGQPLPAEANLEGWDGESVTGGLAQFPGYDHFPIFDDTDAALLYQGFLASSLGGDPPVLELPED